MTNRAFAGVLYAEDFDAPEPVVVPVPEPPRPPIVIEPTFSLADLRRASDQAQEEGRVLERREAVVHENRRQADALVRIADALELARTELAGLAASAASATAETLFAMVGVVLPAFAAARGHDELQALLTLLLPAMQHEPRLTIRVQPSLLDGLREAAAPLLEDGPALVDWIAAETMLPGDITVRWQDGLMMRDTRALCAQVRALVMPDSKSIRHTEDDHDG